MLPALALRLRLAAQALRRPGPSARAAAAVARPEALLIWLRIAANAGADAAPGAALLIRRLARMRPGIALFVTAPPAIAAALPETVIRFDPPEDDPASAHLVLARWRPDLIVLLGNDLPAGLISAAAQARIGVMLADAHVAHHAPQRGFLARQVQRALLARIGRISVRDAESSAALVRLGADPMRIELGGVLAEPPEPLHCSEAERASIAALVRTRPVWLAAAVPEAEMATVLAAHAHAQRHAHRMLLILAPDASETGAALAERLEAEGWAAARRTLEGEPDENTDIFLADDPAEYGLWYRIAPVTYLGGTLSGATGHARSPLEAAALGSAVVHGHQTAPFAAEFARLDDARATRTVYDAHSLGEALSDLMAPDRAAVLAHNAWVVTSSGAGAAEALARAILAELDTHRAAQLEAA